MAGRGSKWLIGCAAGCAGIVLVLVAVGVAFSMWLKRSEGAIDPVRLLGADTTGQVEIDIDLDDPGSARFAEELIGAIRATRGGAGQALPSILRGLLEVQQDAQEADLRQLFPLRLVWTRIAVDGPGGAIDLLTVTAGGLGNRLKFIDWMLGMVVGRDARSERAAHRDEVIFTLRGDRGGSATLFIRGSDLFFVADMDDARHVIDRLLAPADETRAPSELERWFAGSAADGVALRGAVSNARGEFNEVVDRLHQTIGMDVPRADLWERARGAVLRGRFEVDGSLVANLRLPPTGGGWTPEEVAELALALRGLAGESLPLEVTGTVDGDEAVLQFQVVQPGSILAEHLARWIEGMNSGVRLRVGS